MSGVLRWEKPPDGRTARAAERAAKFQPIADALRERPGDWAVVAEGDTAEHSAIAGYIRTGSGPFAPAKSFEVKQHSALKDRKGPRVGTVYARYVGGDQ